MFFSPRVGVAGLFGPRETGIGTAMIAPAPMALQVVGQQSLVIGREIGLRPLDCFPLACRDVDAEFLRQIHDVAPGMAVTFGELSDQVLDAGRGHGDDTLLFALSQRYLFAQRAFEHRFEVGHN
jgi:hypothetical protein